VVLTAISRCFPSLDAFYADDRRRRDSLRWFLDRLGGLRPVAA
jgi:hypothetical protein